MYSEIIFEVFDGIHIILVLRKLKWVMYICRMKMSNFKLGYYTHNILKNNTKEEEQEYEYIRSCFNGFTLCPNKHLGYIGSMSNYLDSVSKADVVFTSELNGFVGIGVYKECKHALEIGTPIL